MAKGVKKKVVEVPLYTAKIKVLGVYHTATGTTKDAAISALQVSNARGTSILAVSNGEKSQEKVFNTMQTIRLFSQSSTVRAVALKNTLSRFSL